MSDEEKVIIELIVVAILIYLSHCVYKASQEIEKEKNKKQVKKTNKKLASIDNSNNL